MRLVESSEAATSAERAALDDMRRQLRDWEQARRQLRSTPSPSPPASPALTYRREDARAQVRARRRAPAPAPAPAPPRGTRSRGTVHINLWRLDAARRRPLRNGTLDAWLANAADADRKHNDNNK